MSRSQPESEKMKSFMLHAIYHCGKMQLDDVLKGLKTVWPEIGETECNSLIYKLVQGGFIENAKIDTIKYVRMTNRGYILRHKPCKPYWYVILKIKFFMILRVIFAELMYHPKSDGFYLRWDLGAKLEKDCSGVVCYTDIYDTTWIRPSSEFYDGRFMEWTEANSLLRSSDQTGK